MVVGDDISVELGGPFTIELDQPAVPIGAAIAKREDTGGEQKLHSPDASLEANLAHNKYSFKTDPAGVDRFSSSLFSGRFMRVGKDKYLFRKVAKEDIAKIKVWCSQHGVSSKGF